MNYRFCHRCHADLPPHDEGTLIFCIACGAPQVLLSEELREQVEQQNQTANGTESSPAARNAGSQIWAGAMRCIAIAGSVTAALAVVSMFAPTAGFLSWLWAVISPVVVIGLFQSKYPLAPITAGFGARLGLLTGVGIAAVSSVMNTLELLVRRFATHGHGMVEIDGMWNGIFAQVQAQTLQQSGASALPMVQALGLPEFRAGIILSMMAITIVMLLVITTAGGAFAGFVRARQRAQI